MKCILGALWKHPEAPVFEAPVSLVDYPDYLTYVKAPMDLQEVTRKVRERKYVHLQAMEAELNLIGANCIAYCRDKYPEMAETARSFMEDVKKQVQSGAELLKAMMEAPTNYNCNHDWGQGMLPISEEKPTELDHEKETEEVLPPSKRLRIEDGSSIEVCIQDQDQGLDQTFIPPPPGLLFDSEVIVMKEASVTPHITTDISTRKERLESIHSTHEVKISNHHESDPVITENVRAFEDQIRGKLDPRKGVQVICKGKAEKIGIYRFQDGMIQCLCGCQNPPMLPTVFERHAQCPSKKPLETIHLVTTGMTLGDHIGNLKISRNGSHKKGQPKTKKKPCPSQGLVARRGKRKESAQSRFAGILNEITHHPKCPEKGLTFEVYLHVSQDSIPPFFPMTGLGKFLLAAGSRSTRNEPTVKDRKKREESTSITSLAAITGSKDERSEKLDQFRDGIASRARVDDNVALETDDIWEGHAWWAAKVVVPVYTVTDPFSRGEMTFEEGDRVLDVMWYDRDPASRAGEDCKFFLLDAIDTVFSYSVVDAKFPLVQLKKNKVGSATFPTTCYSLKKSDAKEIDKSVSDQEAALGV